MTLSLLELHCCAQPCPCCPPHQLEEPRGARCTLPVTSAYVYGTEGPAPSLWLLPDSASLCFVMTAGPSADPVTTLALLRHGGLHPNGVTTPQELGSSPWPSAPSRGSPDCLGEGTELGLSCWL